LRRREWSRTRDYDSVLVRARNNFLEPKEL
jgi:hypothetical protein